MKTPLDVPSIAQGSTLYRSVDGQGRDPRPGRGHAEDRHSPIPSHRASRLLHLGRLAGGIAGGMMAEGVRRLASGQLPSAGDLFLTADNAKRLAERLSQLRGAAMKVGQLLSMEAGEFLPAELTAALGRLREDAHTMPISQVRKMLVAAWGNEWLKDFQRFNFRPLAAASIGQVHEAVTRDGDHLAVKIQYPGVRRSIDSDVDNVSALLSMFRVLPDKADVKPLLEEAKRQLHLEADYQQEALNIEAYRQQLGQDSAFAVPRVVNELTTPEVLAMSFVPGVPIERLAGERSDLRNQVSANLLSLALRELFDWGLVQTDPNFANYRYDSDSGRIGLLDFGATRTYPPERVDKFRRLLRAAAAKDYDAVESAAADAGYVSRSDAPAYRAALVDLLMDASEPARQSDDFDFSASDLASRMSEKILKLRLEQRIWRLPPPDILFLHRKLGGFYLLFTKLRARVNIKSLMMPYAAG